MITMMDLITKLTIVLFVSSVASQTTDLKYRRCKDKQKCVRIEQCHYGWIKPNGNIFALTSEMISRLTERCGSFNKVCCPEIDRSSIVFENEQVFRSRPKAPLTPLNLVKLPTTTAHAQTTEAIANTERPIEVKTQVPSEPFSDRSICGQLTNSDRILGGTITAIDEFPWLALVTYVNSTQNRVERKCSASLITNRHLLSAAHCFASNRSRPYSIRLGVWNAESPKDCYGECPDPPVEIEIERVLLHPKFDRKNLAYGDIAIITLKKPVTFTGFIQPICLPTTEYVKLQDYMRESTYWSAGWGLTEFGAPSAIKRKVDLDAVPMDICRIALNTVPESSSEVLICAGAKAGKDSCNGDSGGPLMREVKENYKLNWFLYGVTSFGVQRCGQEGIPGVYTRVTAYMDWIRENVQT